MGENYFSVREKITSVPIGRVRMTHPETVPRMVVRMMPAVYQSRLLPKDLPLETLQEVARRECISRKLSTCLIIGPREAYYYDPPDGRMTVSTKPPRAGVRISK